MLEEIRLLGPILLWECFVLKKRIHHFSSIGTYPSVQTLRYLYCRVKPVDSEKVFCV